MECTAIHFLLQITRTFEKKLSLCRMTANFTFLQHSKNANAFCPELLERLDNRPF